MEKKGNRLVVADAGWAETIPEWLLEEVRQERIVLGMANIIDPGLNSVGDAEICVYLYTLSLRQPLDTEYTNIYIYLTARLMQKTGKKLEDFMEKKLQSGLSRDETRELETLRNRLQRVRGEVSHPLLDVLRQFKKGYRNNENPEEETQSTVL